MAAGNFFFSFSKGKQYDTNLNYKHDIWNTSLSIVELSCLARFSTLTNLDINICMKQTINEGNYLAQYMTVFILWKHTVSWRQNPELFNLFHKGKHDCRRNSWKIEAYLQEILETFGQSTGSSTAVTPSLYKISR